jgi:hypothetical protein
MWRARRLCRYGTAISLRSPVAIAAPGNAKTSSCSGAPAVVMLAVRPSVEAGVECLPLSEQCAGTQQRIVIVKINFHGGIDHRCDAANTPPHNTQKE